MRITWIRAVDGVFVLVVLVTGIAEVWVPLASRQGSGDEAVSTVQVIVVALALWWRRSHPLPTAAVVAAGLILPNVVEPGFLLFCGQFVPLAVATFSVARHRRGRGPWLGAVLLAATLIYADLFIPLMGPRHGSRSAGGAAAARRDAAGGWRCGHARPAAGHGGPQGVIRVAVVDDQELLREGFRLILERAGMEVVGEAADGLEAVAVCRATSPDLVLMDVRMPRLDGIEATRRIVSAQPAVRVLALTTFDLDEYVYGAVRAGASGFVLKDISPRDLVHAVEVVARGEAMLAPSLTRRLLARFAALPSRERPSVPEVTARELSVLRLVARGMSNTEIARELFLAEATVKTYVSRMLTKLGLRDRVQLAVLAYETGLVQPGDPRAGE